MGEDREAAVDLRVVSATNRNLEEMVSQGSFRADLFHRLNILSCQIPPLRTRSEDVKPLIEHFLNKYHRINPDVRLRTGIDFIEALTRADLPGNARQLENLVRWALANKIDDSPLSLSDLPMEIWLQLSRSQEKSPPPLDVDQPIYKTRQSDDDGSSPEKLSWPQRILDANGWNLLRSVENCEKLLLESAIHLYQGNQSKTAKLLGITPRSIYNKIRKYHLNH